ncbi:unnamed protein product, partial [Porites evermanni]
ALFKLGSFHDSIMKINNDNEFITPACAFYLFSAFFICLDVMLSKKRENGINPVKLSSVKRRGDLPMSERCQQDDSM